MPSESAPPPVIPAGDFDDVARLELDQLLEQMIARAKDVLATQGRLRGLIRANLAVASAVDLGDLLSGILEAARELVGARYAALGIVDDGRLINFLHSGLDGATVQAIGHLPQGKGILGRLIDDPEPLRLADLGDDVASVGFPEHHPPMRSFLGVPIQIGAQIFGNLYLTDKQGAPQFSQDDEHLVVALATAAGAAITNAAQFADARRRQDWLTAMSSLSTAVLTADDPARAPALIDRFASAAAGAVGSSVCVPDGHDGLRVAAASGVLAGRVGQSVPMADTIYAEALQERRTVLLVEAASDPRIAGRVPPGIGPIVAAPMLTDVSVDGVIFLCRPTGGGGFSAVELEMIEAYARHAALVHQLVHARRDNEFLRLVDDRRQIAEDLRQRVIQRVSMLAMQLLGLAGRVHDAGVRTALQERVNDTDEIIRELRSAIFDIGGPDPDDITVGSPAQDRGAGAANDHGVDR
jgi:GAF domain-containing protein